MAAFESPDSARPDADAAEAEAARRIPPSLVGEDAVIERGTHNPLANIIGREIVGGLVPPGGLLPTEETMRERFSVSRTALREAYSMLTAKGLLAARPKIGTRVRPKSDWNMLDPDILAWHLQTIPTGEIIADLYAVRMMMEVPAAGMAARERSDEALGRIADAYADMERFRDGGGDLIAADLRFHLAILEATGNAFVGAFGALIHAALLGTFEVSWQGAARIRTERLHQHGAILDAIRAGDPAAAEARMRELLNDSIGDVREALANGPTA